MKQEEYQQLAKKVILFALGGGSFLGLVFGPVLDGTIFYSLAGAVSAGVGVYGLISAIQLKRRLAQ